MNFLIVSGFNDHATGLTEKMRTSKGLVKYLNLISGLTERRSDGESICT